MKNMRTCIFFSFSSDNWLQSYVFRSFFDFAIISLWKLVNKISGELLELG